MDAINLYSLAYPVTSLGPGLRVAFWVAGCGKDCPGCISPEMRPPDSGTRVPGETLLRRLLELEPGLSGVTVSGGEPFDQAGPLAGLLHALRVERPDWTVIIYTGYCLAELRRKSPEVADLLDCADVLIDGPYLRDVTPAHPLAGSGNQVVHYLTERGRGLQREMDSAPCQQVNLGLGRGDFNMVIGVVDESCRRAFEDALKPGGEQGGSGAHKP